MFIAKPVLETSRSCHCIVLLVAIMMCIVSILLSCVKVRWGPDNMDGHLSLYSVSADGRVTNWTIVRTDLRASNILEVPVTGLNNNGDHLNNDNKLLGRHPLVITGTCESLILKYLILA